MRRHMINSFIDFAKSFFNVSNIIFLNNLRQLLEFLIVTRLDGRRLIKMFKVVHFLKICKEYNDLPSSSVYDRDSSYDVASGCEITPCNKIDKPLVFYNVLTPITTLRT